MGENSGPRTLFWIMLLVAWPYALYKVFCILTLRPVPFGQYKAGHFFVELVKNGVADQGAISHAWRMLGIEAVVFLVITIIAYMHSYYPGQRY